MAVSGRNDAEKICPDRGTTQAGVDKWNDTRSAGNISTIGFIAGGVGVAAGVVLWVTAPSRAGTSVGIGPGTLQVKGTF
jgi:hypothetical protein